MVLRINARFFRQQEEIHPGVSESLQLVQSHADLLGKTVLIVGESFIGDRKVYIADFLDALPTISFPAATDAVDVTTMIQVQ